MLLIFSYLDFCTLSYLCVVALEVFLLSRSITVVVVVVSVAVVVVGVVLVAVVVDFLYLDSCSLGQAACVSRHWKFLTD